ncbi:Nucleoid occlusion protein [subsurface metagenome]
MAEESAVERVFMDIPVDSIRKSRHGLRTIASEQGLAELRSSIAAKGVLVPIVVEETDAGYRVIAGTRRVLCAESLGLASIPAEVVMASEEWKAWATVAENRLREAVNAYDEAVFVEAEIERQGIDQKQMAEVLGVSEAWISKRLAILKWPEDVRGPMIEGLMTFAVARELAGIGDEPERRQAVKSAVGAGATARQAAEWRRNWQRSRQQVPGLGPGGSPGAEAELVAVGLNRCIVCEATGDGKSGRVVWFCDTCWGRVGRALMPEA